MKPALETFESNKAYELFTQITNCITNNERFNLNHFLFVLFVVGHIVYTCKRSVKKCSTKAHREQHKLYKIIDCYFVMILQLMINTVSAPNLGR